jgi:hypothetical protein
MRKSLLLCVAAMLGMNNVSGGFLQRSGDPVDGLAATGHDSRIDLEWKSPGDPNTHYAVFRSTNKGGPFERINDQSCKANVYSDFIGTNGVTFFYKVGASQSSLPKLPPAGTAVSATTRAMSDEELLTSVQEATFRYFWHYGHPVSGLARERTDHDGDECTTGGSGFGLMAIIVGVERGFVTREAAAERMLKILTFLEEKAVRFHGAFSHWLNGATGETLPFAGKNGVRADNGGDIVETSFLIQGMLAVRLYFNSEDPVEREIRERATRMWREVEWDWYLREPGGKQLYWHWSPEYGWMMNHPIGGHFNECLITYLLALASPTHPIPPECYEEGWVVDPEGYANPDTYYGYRQWVGMPMGGRMFFTHYSFLGFDPRSWRDQYCNYFENSRNISLIHRAYCIQNPKRFEGYGEQAWGLTSCVTPDGYRGLDPMFRDNGTIAPTAALSAMVYTPEESMVALRHYYHDLGPWLWGEFGFYDAFNLKHDWFAKDYLAIDQGPIICMIENHRSGLLWNLFMANPEIEPMLKSIGWTKTNTKEIEE